uniref:Uncharacterized protein n=1 Tax=Meloidogyne enterolobii TaxID=390850 RepID=A0A6V7VSU7_MELEN|nr:unnamed protein product [Meloidogyne enterolobii]
MHLRQNVCYKYFRRDMENIHKNSKQIWVQGRLRRKAEEHPGERTSPPYR